MIERVPIYITRKSVFEMKVGGADRLEIWFDRPHRQSRRNEAYPDSTPWFVMESNTHRSLSGKAIRRMDRREEGSMVFLLWDLMCRTAFPGIDYEDWDVGHREDHPDAVPEDLWIGEAELLMSLEPFEGAIEAPIVVTGPFPSHMMWQGDLEAPVSDALVWFTPPHFQALEGWDADEIEASCGKRPRQHWSGNGYTAEPFYAVRDIERLGLAQMSSGARRAITAEFGSSDNAIVGRAWSTSFPLWIAVSTGMEQIGDPS